MIQWRFAGPATQLFSDLRAGPIASDDVRAGRLRSIGKVNCDDVVVVLGDIVDGLAPLQKNQFSATATTTSARRTILPVHPNPTASDSSNAVSAALLSSR